MADSSAQNGILVSGDGRTAETFELMYFHLRMVGDVPRYLLDIGGATYKNVFLTDDDEFWPIKEDNLFGKLPRLTIKAADGSEKVR